MVVRYSKKRLFLRKYPVFATKPFFGHFCVGVCISDGAGGF